MSSENREPNRNSSRRGREFITLIGLINGTLLNSILQKRKHLGQQFKKQPLLCRNQITIQTELFNLMRVPSVEDCEVSLGELEKGSSCKGGKVIGDP